MSLQGFYTEKGLALAAKLISGGYTLAVTRVLAGSGQTKKSATVLASTKQELILGSVEAGAQSVVLRATLAESLAGETYDLTELGVYANDPEEGEILYQVIPTDALAQN